MRRLFVALLQAAALMRMKKELLDKQEEDEEILALPSPSKKPSKSSQSGTLDEEWRATPLAKFFGYIKKSPIPAPEHAASPAVKTVFKNWPTTQPTKGKE